MKQRVAQCVSLYDNIKLRNAMQYLSKYGSRNAVLAHLFPLLGVRIVCRDRETTDITKI